MRVHQFAAVFGSLCVIIYAIAIRSPVLQARNISATLPQGNDVEKLDYSGGSNDTLLAMAYAELNVTSISSAGAVHPGVGLYDDESWKKFWHKVKKVLGKAGHEIKGDLDAARRELADKMPWNCDKACYKWHIAKWKCQIRCRLLDIPDPAIWLLVP